jgi:beta-phosphoglucomutase-like phosphatase (HAD superfamily)
MHLVMFDIDGTLTETMKVDEECFVRSFKDVFGFADIDTDWSHYPRTTDSRRAHAHRAVVNPFRCGFAQQAEELSRAHVSTNRAFSGCATEPFFPATL